MWFGLILILCAVPLLELALLIKLGQAIGFWATVAVLLVAGSVGVAILNAQGMAAFRRANESLAAGRPPVEAVMDGFMLMIAGGLLLMPGLLSDIAGLLLLIPPLRRLVARWWIGSMGAAGTVKMTTWRSREATTDTAPPRDFPSRPRPAGSRGTVIDGEFERLDEKPAGPRTDREPPTRP